MNTVLLALTAALSHPAPPGSVVIAPASAAWVSGGIPIYDGTVVWGDGGDIAWNAPDGHHAIRTLHRPAVPTKPVRAELVSLYTVTSQTPLEVAIDAARERLRRAWVEVVDANNELLELESRRDAGETER